MPVTSKLYGKFPMNLGGGDAAAEGPMDLLSDTIKVALYTSTASGFVQDTSESYAVTNEVSASGTGYTAGGATLGSKTYTATSLTTTFDAADSSWSSATFSAAACQIYDDTVASPSKPLICYTDFGGTQSVAGATFTLVWNASGIFTITVA